MKIEMDEIKSLIDTFIKSGLGEMEIESHGTRLCLKKEASGAASAALTAYPAGGSAVFAAGSVQQESGGKESAPDAGSSEETHFAQVKAPIAGVFYRSPAPGKKPYVTEGSKVKKGDVIGLMEAMKLMNEVVSPADGIVRKILAENAVFCEYNIPLMEIEEEG